MPSSNHAVSCDIVEWASMVPGGRGLPSATARLTASYGAGHSVRLYRQPRIVMCAWTLTGLGYLRWLTAIIKSLSPGDLSHVRATCRYRNANFPERSERPICSLKRPTTDVVFRYDAPKGRAYLCPRETRYRTEARQDSLPSPGRASQAGSASV